MIFFSFLSFLITALSPRNSKWGLHECSYITTLDPPLALHGPSRESQFSLGSFDCLQPQFALLVRRQLDSILGRKRGRS